ncbi:MAG: Rieske 2Fe-2S domain-containing protein [Ilumatobacteraceae bacterium]|nr:Rieske 2Fe-2S domain-containing protein [Ilumatobacteraceae bacterium]
MNPDRPEWADSIEIVNAEGVAVTPTSWRPLGHDDRVAVTVSGIEPEILVVSTDEGLRAIANVCIHRGFALDAATLLTEHDENHRSGTTCIKCPLHGLILSLDTGLACRTGKGQRIPTFEVAMQTPPDK